MKYRSQKNKKIGKFVFMRNAAAVILSEKERQHLERWAKARSIPLRQIVRAQIILGAASGKNNKQIADDLGTDEHTVRRWRQRFLKDRLKGIAKDAPRSGRCNIKRKTFQDIILKTTLEELPPDGERWSSRALAKKLGLSPSMILRVWRSHGIFRENHDVDQRFLQIYKR